MPSTNEDTTLPQYGFGHECSFESLITHNPFLYRIHTPKAAAHASSSTASDVYFIGNRFNQDFKENPEPVPLDEAHEGTYAEVAGHMDWTTRPMSPYVSASFSVVWAVWEATRRYRSQHKHDVHIAVIDARALTGHAFTALELLRLGSTKERTRDYWKWHKFAVESQEVLIHGVVPSSAVVASIPLNFLVSKFPSYFLHNPSSTHTSSLDRLAWDYNMNPKQSYRQFCTAMSDRFLAMSSEARLCETTAASVRLAIALLGPWFDEAVHEDFEGATGDVATLAFGLAQWPAKWWTKERTEIWSVVYAMVDVIGEQVRSRDGDCDESLGELERLQNVVAGLQRTVDVYALRTSTPLPLPLTPKGKEKAREFNFKAIAFGGAMTPPATPGLTFGGGSSSSSRSVSPPPSPSPVARTLQWIALEDGWDVVQPMKVLVTSPITPPATPPSTPASKVTSPRSAVGVSAAGGFPFSGLVEAGEEFSDDDVSLVDVFEPKTEEVLKPVKDKSVKPFEEIMESPPSTPPPTPKKAPTLRVIPPSANYHLESLWDSPVMDLASLWNTPAILSPIEETARPRRSQRVGDTISCLVTGLIFGAFVTLLAVSGQKRYIIHNLT